MSNNKFFLKDVKLSGYKSIIDTKIDFKEGLNIIIGKNASGKTNFLEFLDKSLSFNFDDLFEFNSTLNFDGNDEVKILTRNIFTNNPNSTIQNTEFEVFKNKKQIEVKQYIENVLFDNGLDYLSYLVKHGVPRNYQIADLQFSFESPIIGFSKDLTSQIHHENLPSFIKSLLGKIFFQLRDKIFVKFKNNESPVDKKIIEKEIKSIIENVFNDFDNVKKQLNKYSPIKDIRLNKTFNFLFIENKQSYTVKNLFFEYKIDNNWYPFSSLSDGTKRLFYLISEVANTNNFKVAINSFRPKPDNFNKIILIEEPELGVHPHQLMMLMNFLKEESESKQIIITTHSPMVLDILGKEDLDRLIISEMKDKDGTKLRHLTDKEKEKASKYMDDIYLSDYWKYSDLEK